MKTRIKRSEIINEKVFKITLFIIRIIGIVICKINNLTNKVYDKKLTKIYHYLTKSMINIQIEYGYRKLKI